MVRGRIVEAQSIFNRTKIKPRTKTQVGDKEGEDANQVKTQNNTHRCKQETRADNLQRPVSHTRSGRVLNGYTGEGEGGGKSRRWGRAANQRDLHRTGQCNRLSPA